MDDVYEKYKDNPNVAMYVLFIREAHPNQMRWRDIDQPTEFEERRKLATATCDEDHMKIPVLIDNMDNAVGIAYGRLPNSALIIDKNGIIVEKQGWADPAEIDNVLARLLQEESSESP